MQNRQISLTETCQIITETLTETEKDIQRYMQWIEKGATIALLVVQMLQAERITLETKNQLTTRDIKHGLLAQEITEKIIRNDKK